MKVLDRKMSVKRRVRAKIVGTAKRPRLAIHISNRHLTAQLIDDDKKISLAYVTTVNQPMLVKQSMTKKADWLGMQIAALAKKKKIATVVFDRGVKTFHGRIKAVASAARKNGLNF